MNENITNSPSNLTRCGIVNDSMIFTILSQNLYSDKILATVREISQNALDSHISADKVEVPITVELPDQGQGNRFFIVKDQGTGISPEDFKKFYGNLGESSKREDVKAIGGFGIGKFAFLAYAAEAFITVVHNGNKTFYRMFKDAEKFPTYDLMSTEATTEPNGVEVKVPVAWGDSEKFEQAARKVFQFYPTRPTVNRELQYIKHDWRLKGGGWRMSGNKHESGLYAIVGPNLHKINTQQFGFSSYVGGNYYLSFTVNEIALVPSREDISYDEGTISNISAKLKLVAQEVQEILQEGIDAQSSFPLAARYLHSIKNISMQDSFTYKGTKYSLGEYVTSVKKSIDEMYVGALSEDKFGITENRYKPRYRKGFRFVNEHLNVQDYFYAFLNNGYETAEILVDDVPGKKFLPRLKEYLQNSQTYENRNGKSVLVLRKVSAENVEAICNFLLIDKSKVLSANGTLPVKERKPRAPATANVYEFQHGRAVEKRKVTDLGDDLEIFYMEDDANNRNSEIPRVFYQIQSTIMAALKAAGSTDTVDNRRIFFIPKRNMKFFAAENLIELNSYAKKVMKKYEPEVRAYAIETAKAGAAYEYSSTRGATHIFEHLGVSIKRANAVDFSTIQRLAAYTPSLEDNVVNIKSAIQSNLASILSRYPLLDNICDGNRYCNMNEQQVKHYVALCDAVILAGKELPKVEVPAES